ncbi:cytochrome P450 3A9-like [Crassostrea angulata]|uniref:cytochrome P450 3A9-like n=1 Tax=Magallana angulata TaxID=2784310 RepID=UPI0022B1E7B0|nr:cytochrome P450 3A9-like [Crassostrea angulata]
MIFYIATVIFIILALYKYLVYHFNTFERLGIPGPKPTFFLGNLLEIRNKGQLQAIIDWRKEYGRIFGYFEGYTPVLSVSDPDLLKDVLVKDFENFQSRKPFPLAPRKSLGLFLENGHQWKRSRTLLTPAFSAGKLKQMFGIMNECTDHLLESMNKKAKSCKTLDIYDLFQCLTLDVIGRCAFGLRTNAQADDKDPFLINVRSLFSRLSKTMILPAVMLLPFLQYFVFAMKNIVVLFGMNPVVWIRMKMKEIIQIRREMGANASTFDLVQQMLFSKVKDGSSAFSEREIVAQSMTFLLAGYETTSTVLAFFSHVLAHNQSVQKKLFDEVDSTIGNTEVNYENVKELPYFDMVFDEVCRLYPTASLIVTRQAKNTATYNGITIPAGMNIQADVWSLHHDEEFWEQPSVFNPDRFRKENKQQIKSFSFLPFGAGPRSCIGSRFAMLETKVAMVRVLKQFSFTPCAGSTKDIELDCRGAIVPKHGINVQIESRDKSAKISRYS